MKTLRLIGMALFAILLSVNFTACSNNDEIIVNDDEQETYTVKLGLGGEILNIKDEPLSRATSDDLYGIQVYSTPNKELGTGATPTWTKYAYGLFDNPESISINLLKGYKYKFVATMIVNAKNVIQSITTEDNQTAYKTPFSHAGAEDGPTVLNNTFSYTSNSYMSRIDNGSANVVGHDKIFKRSKTNRFYGELTNFIPSSNNTASIPMKRVSFGASFVAINSIAKSGTLEIQMEDAQNLEIDFTAGLLDDFWVKDIFTFSDVAAAYAKDDYTEIIPVTINWHREDGGTVPLGTHDITYKRNRNTIVTILIKKGGADSELGFAVDESETTDINNMTEDGNTTIEDGEIVETEIEVSKAVTVSTVGTLSTFISDDEKYNITSLTISGPLNGTDIAFLRDIISTNDEGVVKGNITMLDLSQTSIVGGEEPYMYAGSINGDPIPMLTEDNQIGPHMFYGCEKLQTIKIPSNVTKIGGASFQFCSNLTSIILPETLIEIGTDAFYKCSQLGSIIIPSSVTNIGDGAFASCSNLAQIHCKAIIPPTIGGETTFYNIPLSSCRLFVPTGSKTAYEEHDYWKVFINIEEE